MELVIEKWNARERNFTEFRPQHDSQYSMWYELTYASRICKEKKKEKMRNNMDLYKYIYYYEIILFR